MFREKATSRTKAVGSGVAIAVLIALSLALVADFPPPEQLWVGTRYGNQVLVPSNQLLNPAGQRIEFAGRPVDMALSPQGDVLAVLLPNAIQLFSSAGKTLRTLKTQAASFLGVAFTPNGEWVVASQVSSGGAIALGDVQGQAGVVYMKVPPNSVPAGLVFDSDGSNLYVALSRTNALGRLFVDRGEVVATVDVGVAPLGVALTPRGDRLFVTNWGGRRALKGEMTAPSAGTATLADERGIASSGTVSVVDVASFQVIAEVAVGLHPSAVGISPDGSLAAVANANSDSITLLDTDSLRVVDTVAIPAFPRGYLGSSPVALAFSPTGQWLYVACAGNNALAVLERLGQSYRLRGFVPTDWYPVAAAVSASGDGGETVYVANSKGIGSRNATRNFNVLNHPLGTFNIFPGRTVEQAAQAAVAFSNDPFRDAAPPSGSPRNLADLGIRHVFFIIKENRTYDQVLGDLGRGNGDKSLAIYGSEVTPNQHEMAGQFVTLDNFYASGARSPDGHQWLTQAMVTDYVERAHAGWPRSYPFWGDDPLAFASSGFIWNNAQDAGRTVRVFGEFTLPTAGYSGNWIDYYRDSQLPEMKLTVRSTSQVAPLNAVVESNYPAYALNIPDVYRARVFLKRFGEFQEKGDLPNLVIIHLPANHTAGASPNFPTPRAMVADNDVAAGRMVEAITKSAYWPRTAIFIVEDDAQDGVDHVDGHRTVCLVISPFVRRGAVDSTHYNQTSIVRTIEELLGLPPMNKFDAAALPMRSVFTTRPDLRPFESVANRIPLDEMNPSPAGIIGPQRRAILDSMAMDFSRPDAAPEEVLNRILWHTAKGWNTPYPRVPHAPGCRVDDD